MKNILVTGIGGPTPRSIAKQLRSLDNGFNLVGVDCNAKALGFYIDSLVDKHYLIPRVDNASYWDTIKKIIEKEKIDIAFVQPEMEVTVWGEYKIKHGEYPCPVFIPPLSHVN